MREKTFFSLFKFKLKQIVMVKLKIFPKFILLGVMFEIEITVSVLSIVVRVGKGTWSARTF